MKTLSSQPVQLNEHNFEYVILHYKVSQKVYFYCEKCGVYVEKTLKNINPTFLCRKHLIEKTAIERYGSLEKMQQMNIEHGRKTSIERYGSENFKNLEKAKETKQSRYGNPSFTNREKCKKTLKDKYGIENPSQLDSAKLKYKETCIKRYGVDNPTKLKSIRDKMEATLIDRTGIGRVSIYRYEYNNLKFDSQWELYFYIYLEDHNKKFTYQPTFFTYIHNGKEHKYYPDFEVEGQLIEIKGDQFFKEDGTMCNPYDHSLDSLQEAKHQCGLEHGVKFYRRIDMLPIIEYVNRKYTKDYVKSFRKL